MNWINNIQKRVLVNFPTIWNTKLLIMLPVLICMHALFFAIGYIAADTTFDKTYYYSYFGDTEPLLYFFSILTAILLLIGWLLAYNKHNPFKVFYPRKKLELLTELLIIFVITAGMSLIPYTMMFGGIHKWRSLATPEEAKQVIDLLDEAAMLVPYNKYQYEYSKTFDKPIAIPENYTPDWDTDPNLFDTTYDDNYDLQLLGYIGNSLLFYKNSSFDYYPQYDKNGKLISEIRDSKTDKIKQWLIEGKKDSIYTIMRAFQKLQKKHWLKIDITPEQWMQKIYNPPFFPVNISTTIANQAEWYYPYDYIASDTIPSDSITDSYDPTEAQEPLPVIDTLPYLQVTELTSGYNQIIESYDTNDRDNEIALFLCLYAALGVATLIYSFRISNWKSWLTAIVIAGILLFIYFITNIGFTQLFDWNTRGILFLIGFCCWLILFAILLSKVIYKSIKNKDKGRSHIYINLIIWLIPFLIPLIVGSYTQIIDYLVMNKYYVLSKHYDLYSDTIKTIYWCNIPFSIIIMAAFSILVRRWKSLPEE